MDRELKTKYNLRSPSVKRLMREAMELREPNNQYHAQPLEDNLFEWHFTVRGPPDSDFDHGRYHGRIILPPEYPMKPPSIILLTPNGRFEIGKKICLSMSAHHPEGWQPSWSIRTVLLALIGFMPSKGGGAIGALDYTQQERSILAQRSLNWTCDVCQASNGELLPEVAAATNEDAEREAKELATQIDFKGEAKAESSESVNSGITSNPAPVAPPKAHAQQGQMPFTSMYNPYYFSYPLPRPSDTDPNRSGNSYQASLPRDNVEPGHIQLQPSSTSAQPTEKSDQGIEDVKNCNEPLIGQQSAEQRLSAENIGSQEGGDSQVRQRTLPQRDARAPLVTSGTDRRARRSVRDNDGSVFSLVMLWLVTISLVALILRRLCMEALNLNPQG